MAYNNQGRPNNGNKNMYQVPREQKPVQHVTLTNENYVDIAESIMETKVRRNKANKISLTTSKIRNMLSMVSALYDDVIHVQSPQLSSEMVGRIQYLRLHIAYEAGRDGDVKDFVDKADILYQIQQVGNSKEKLLLFSKYMEALVAYHRFFGGQD